MIHEAVILLAQRIEERNDAVDCCRKMKWSWVWRPDGPILSNKSTLGPNMLSPGPNGPEILSSHQNQRNSSRSQHNSDNSKKLVHRLSEAEIRDCRSRGLCFRCDEKFGPGASGFGSKSNKHQRELEFKPRDLVLLKLKPYRLRSLAKKVKEKLSPRFYDPFEALARIGKVAYRLKLPETARIHLVFHISQLKRFLGQEFRVQPLPPQLSEELELGSYPRGYPSEEPPSFQIFFYFFHLAVFCENGTCRQDVDVRFPKSSGMLDIADKSAETEKQIQEIRWQKEKFQDDIKREITLLNKAKGTFATKKAEFLKFLAQSSSYASQFVYVSHFDLGTYVPVVSRLKAVPKRRPCVGTPKDLVLSNLLLLVSMTTRDGIAGGGNNGHLLLPIPVKRPSPSMVDYIPHRWR
ncbi:hypothetical protein EZV62_024536 [Acer yangbiense]|uniref:Uncharacterized protein n=1 Tax=Acer yangbiense TaxID=1000413 RepID=A0A5C7GVK5_9ROSI|nr:hypothetical protein EZV62_024536 [Acer yangbiense]